MKAKARFRWSFLCRSLKQEKPNIKGDLNHALIGIAIEKTIVRYDRVALFVLNKNNELRLETPEWVLVDVNMIWDQVEKVYFFV